MFKNAISIAIGLLIVSTVTMVGSVTISIVSPYKMIDTLAADKLPAFNASQNYEAKNDFEALVRLESKETLFSKREFFCSGTVISDDYVLTAAHCIGGQKGHLDTGKIIVMSLTNQLGQKVEIEAVAAAFNARADYGLIKGDFKRFKKLRVIPDMEQIIGRAFNLPEVITCGFPWGATYICVPGNHMKPYYEKIILDGLLYPGMSGGPVIEPDSRVVIAINSAVIQDQILIAPLIGLFQTLKIKVVNE